jgi:hypothetical protein
MLVMQYFKFYLGRLAALPQRGFVTVAVMIIQPSVPYFRLRYRDQDHIEHADEAITTTQQRIQLREELERLVVSNTPIGAVVTDSPILLTVADAINRLGAIAFAGDGRVTALSRDYARVLDDRLTSWFEEEKGNLAQLES